MQNETTGWTFGEIRSLLREFDSAGIEELIFTEGNRSIALRRTYGTGSAGRDAGLNGGSCPGTETAPEAGSAGPGLAGTNAAEAAMTAAEEPETGIAVPDASEIRAGNDGGTDGAADEQSCVRAPFAGVFYRAAEPGGTPYTAPGAEVKEGDVIGLLEAMKMMNEITAPFDGVIEEIAKEDAEFCAYEEPLFRIRRKTDV